MGLARPGLDDVNERGDAWVKTNVELEKESFDYVIGFVETDVAFVRAFSDVNYGNSRVNKVSSHGLWSSARVRFVQRLAEMFQKFFVVGCCPAGRIKKKSDIKIRSCVRQKTCARSAHDEQRGLSVWEGRRQAAAYFLDEIQPFVVECRSRSRVREDLRAQVFILTHVFWRQVRIE